MRTRLLAAGCVAVAMLWAAWPWRPVFAQASRATAARQEPAANPLAGIVQRPLPLRPGIGPAHEAVTTQSREAQAYYDQGLSYLHSFVWIEAARSFNQALRADGNVALAHVGLSYALGELGDSTGARLAAGAADRLAAKVGGRERLRIELRTRQLRAGASPADAAVQAIYMKALDDAIASYPRDVELLLLVGRAQEPSQHGHGMHVGSAAIQFYERALSEAPDYFATHHYLAHAYENINRPDRALAHAAAFARLAPAVPHAHHMHGHVLRRVARMFEAIESFRIADERGSAYLKDENIPPSFDWHYRHNLDLLGTSYQYVGQMRSAEAVFRRAFELPAGGRATEELNRREWPLFLLARRRPEEALAAANTLTQHPLPLVRALGHILASRATMALKQPEAAASSGNNALRLMRSAGSVGGILVPDLELAQGEHLLRSGQADTGRAMLRGAVAKLRSQTGPDSWIQTLFALEHLGRTAREVNDWVLAADVAEQMRLHDSAYPGTLYAGALLAAHRGQSAAAGAGFRAVAQGWQKADPDVPERVDAERRAATLNAPTTAAPP